MRKLRSTCVPQLCYGNFNARSCYVWINTRYTIHVQCFVFRGLIIVSYGVYIHFQQFSSRLLQMVWDHSDTKHRYCVHMALNILHVYACTFQARIITSRIGGVSLDFVSPVSGYYGPITRCVKLQVAHASGMPGTFSLPTRISDPDMHHGTCVTHVP